MRSGSTDYRPRVVRRMRALDTGPSRSLGMMWRTALCAAVVALAGCADLKPSVPGTQALAQGLHVEPGLPEGALPGDAKPFPHAAFVLLPAQSAVGLLVPLPFITEVVKSAIDSGTTSAAERHYAEIDPQRIVQRALNGSAVLAAGSGGAKLQAFAFVQEGADDHYRLALVAHVRSSDWTGRYLVHLPTAWPVVAYRNPSPAVLAGVRKELEAAALELRALLERAQRGQLAASGVRANVGSLHLVGGKPGGYLSPTLVLARDVEVIDDTPEVLVFRSQGDVTSDTPTGGLFFGVHRLLKTQLHTFEKLPPKNKG
jgi:hypothetical protein